MYIQKDTVTVTTNDSGDGTGYTQPLSGRLSSIQYVLVDFAAGVDFTITAELTGRTLWSQVNVDASAIKAPRQPTHDTAGAASLYAAGSEPVEDYICLSEERVKIVVAQGGDKKSGTFTVTMC